jgi:hypothetical protein
MDLLLPTGAVLGIDVGFSAKKRTTCFCLLAWDQSTVTVDFRITGSETTERARTIAELCNCRELAAVALDGPLVHDLELVKHYRVAEAILSRGVLQKRGKPGQTSAPTGQQLHSHATSLQSKCSRPWQLQHRATGSQSMSEGSLKLSPIFFLQRSSMKSDSRYSLATHQTGIGRSL